MRFFLSKCFLIAFSVLIGLPKSYKEKRRGLVIVEGIEKIRLYRSYGCEVQNDSMRIFWHNIWTKYKLVSREDSCQRMHVGWEHEVRLLQIRDLRLRNGKFGR